MRTGALLNRAIVLLIVLATTSPLHAQQEYGSKPGLEYRAIRCLGDEDDLDLHVVRIDLD